MYFYMELIIFEENDNKKIININLRDFGKKIIIICTNNIHLIIKGKTILASL